MSKTMILTLLAIAQESRTNQPATATLSAFFEEFGIGYRQGKKFILGDQDRERIKQYLSNERGIHWETPVDAWKGASRDESLELGSDEKMSDENVRNFRVAIKSLPGRPLLIGGKASFLPDGANIDIPWKSLVSACDHDEILLIENWTNFEKTHKTPILSGITGNPLVLYRGDLVYGNKYASALLRALGRPVTAFVDYDPAGLLIANSLPGFTTMVCPPESDLHNLLRNCKNSQRFIRQKSKHIHALQSLERPQLLALWKIFDSYGVALPQEKLIQSA